jgi:hypothetical protein
LKTNAETGTEMEIKGGMCWYTNPQDCFYYDLDPKLLDQTLRVIVPYDANALASMFISYAAYLACPTTYIIYEQDRTIPPATQRR